MSVFVFRVDRDQMFTFPDGPVVNAAFEIGLCQYFRNHRRIELGQVRQTPYFVEFFDTFVVHFFAQIAFRFANRSVLVVFGQILVKCVGDPQQQNYDDDGKNRFPL